MTILSPPNQQPSLEKSMKTTIVIALMGIVFVIVASALIPDAFCDSAINNSELTCNSQQ